MRPSSRMLSLARLLHGGLVHYCGRSAFVSWGQGHTKMGIMGCMRSHVKHAKILCLWDSRQPSANHDVFDLDESMYEVGLFLRGEVVTVMWEPALGHTEAAIMSPIPFAPPLYSFSPSPSSPTYVPRCSARHPQSLTDHSHLSSHINSATAVLHAPVHCLGLPNRYIPAPRVTLRQHQSPTYIYSSQFTN